MNKFGNFVVKGRYWFLGIFFCLLVASAVLMNFVNVNYDLTEYLPDNSDTKQSIQLMKDEFGATGTAGMMIKNISEEDASTVAQKIQDLETVSTCVVSRTQTKDGISYAMINIFLTDGDYTTEAEKTLTDIQELMKTQLSENQDYYMIGSAVTAVSSRSAITGEIPIIMIVAVVIVLLVLTLTSRSWFEPIVFLIVIGSAILINMGTNYFLGSISFISNSISSVLLIALAMDYSIVLVTRFREEREKNPNVYEAMKATINGSIVTIIASGCTVMAGLISLVFMNYKIGMDMGLVLTKGVFISLLAVIFLMPAILLLFSKVIQKTEHKNFLRGLSKIGTFAKKTRFVFPIVFLGLVCGAFAVQNQMLQFEYAAKFSQSGNTVYENEQTTKAVFGEQNSLVVIFKAKDGTEVKLDDASQLALFNAIKNLPKKIKVDGDLINSSSSFLTSGTEVDLSKLAKTEPLKITLGEELTLDYLTTNFGTGDLATKTSAAYGTTAAQAYIASVDAQVYQIVIDKVGAKYGYATTNNNSVTLYNALKYLSNEENKADLLASISEVTNNTLVTFKPFFTQAYPQMIAFAADQNNIDKEQQAESVYYSADGSFGRMIFNINAEISSENAIAYVNALNAMLAKDYATNEISIVNNTQNVIETGDVFKQDRLRVELISALAILLICMLSFRSVSLPVILVLIIEGSIWINLAGNALLGNSIFFICYLLGTAIQMGATIDYGILLVDRYKEARKVQNKYTAIKTAIDKSFATIISSGSILTLAAFSIGIFSSVPLISSIGFLIGFGALTASITILFVLPQTLLLLDKFIAKTTLKSNFLYPSRKSKKTANAMVVDAVATPVQENGIQETKEQNAENNSQTNAEVFEKAEANTTEKEVENTENLNLDTQNKPEEKKQTAKKQTAKKNYKTVKKGPKTKKSKKA